MFLKRIHELAHFISDVSKSPEEITKFLVLKTLRDLQPSSLYIGEITPDAHLAPVAVYGVSNLPVVSMGRLSMSLHLPLTDSAKNDKFMVIGSKDDYFAMYPELQKYENLNLNWESVVVWPMLPFGVGFAMLDTKPQKSEELEFFFRTIGEMFILYQIQHSVYMKKSNVLSLATNTASDSLSPRQNEILKLLKLGKTNLEICRELGFSESLIRQETVKIYRILRVSGRKELLENQDEQSKLQDN